jgi:hypothetical protein
VGGSWLDISGPGGTRREILREGLTRIGHGEIPDEVEIRVPLSSLGPSAREDQLHVWNRPPRAVFLGEGTPPNIAGRPFDETALRPGDVIEWAGLSLSYGGSAAEEDLASLEELPGETGTPPTSLASSPEQERIWKRLVAGMMVELDMTDRGLVRRWQKRVMEGEFVVEECAQELYQAGKPGIDDLRLLERSGRLLRDFLMAPLARGARGAGRRARRATKRGLAYLAAQFIAIAVYSLILVLIMAFLYQRGISFDALFERVLSRN